MVYGFLVYYRFKPMTKEESLKAKDFWRSFSRESWPKDLKIVGDYKHAWGSEWNGFLVIETENPQLFFEFWPLFRDETRWYIENTRTIIGVKRNPAEWLKNHHK